MKLFHIIDTYMYISNSVKTKLALDIIIIDSWVICWDLHISSFIKFIHVLMDNRLLSYMSKLSISYTKVKSLPIFSFQKNSLFLLFIKFWFFVSLSFHFPSSLSFHFIPLHLLFLCIRYYIYIYIGYNAAT